MKKGIQLFLLMLVSAVLLIGCSSSPNYKVTMTKPLYFAGEKSVPVEIKVTEENKPVKGLDISAELSMASMDHGTTQIKLTEGDNGKYSGKAVPTMDGKYEITFTMKKDGKTTEKTVEYTIKKAQGVAVINGEWIQKEELSFYQLVNQLQLVINREAAVAKYSGDELKEELDYIDTQKKTSIDQNKLLTQMIQIRAMSLLAEERGHKAAPEEIQAMIAKDEQQYNQYPAAKELIQQFGVEKYQSLEQKEYKYLVLAKQVEADVREQTKKENPEAGEQELNYQTQQNYDDLLVSQMNSLDLTIF